MELYIVIGKLIKDAKNKFEDYRIQKSDAQMPEGYKKAFGPASLDDCVHYLQEIGGTQTGWRTLTYLQYALIGIVTLAFVYIIINGAWKLFGNTTTDVGITLSLLKNADDGARILITFLVAVSTVAIAFLAMLTAMVIREYKERFALAKEVLTLLVGILGTIVGFYFGTASKDVQPANSNTGQTTANPASPNTTPPANKPNTGNNANTTNTATPAPTVSGRRIRLSSGKEILITYTANKKRKIVIL